MLNEENATGLNPSKAKLNIHNYYIACIDAGKILSNGFYNFYNELRYSWASENAVIFDKEFSYKIASLLTEFETRSITACINATTAYNSMVKAMGNVQDLLDPEYIVEYSTNSMNKFHIEQLGTLQKELNNITGMNISFVKDYILPQLSSDVNKSIIAIENLPTEIALLDTGNVQKSAFCNTVTEIKDRVLELYKELEAAINTAILKEINAVELAKQQSTDALNG